MMYAPVMTSLNALTLEETVSHRSDTILFFDVIYAYYNTLESNLFPDYEILGYGQSACLTQARLRCMLMQAKMGVYWLEAHRRR